MFTSASEKYDHAWHLNILHELMDRSLDRLRKKIPILLHLSNLLKLITDSVEA
jgi:hypothetical protein